VTADAWARYDDPDVRAVLARVRRSIDANRLTIMELAKTDPDNDDLEVAERRLDDALDALDAALDDEAGAS
jgi:hypothetical protein